MVAPHRVGVVLAVAVAAAAQATTLIALDLPALTQSASQVVRGRVTSVTSRWTSDHARIMTDAVIEVAETWKGGPAGAVTVMQPGGVVGDVGQRVHGTVALKPGDEVVVFLEPRGDRFILAGMVQGVFRVERTSDGAGAFARQELEGEALFLDAQTHQPVTPTSAPQPLEQLRAKVLALAAPVSPTTPGTRPAVKVTP